VAVDAYFGNFWRASYQLFQTVLEANFPAIMVAPYAQSPFLACVYFFSFLILTVYFILNLILSIVIDVYNDFSADLEKGRTEDREFALAAAFDLLDEEHSGRINVHSLRQLLLVAARLASIPQVRDEALDSVCTKLDADRDGWIDKGDFLRLPAVLKARVERDPGPTFLQRAWPTLAYSRCFVAYGRLFTSNVSDYVIDGVVITNLIVAASAAKSGSHRLLDLVQIISTIVFVIEMASKLLVLGYRRYFNSYANWFDAILTVLSVVGILMLVVEHQRNVIFVLLRIFRLCRLLLACPQFKDTAATFIKVIPSAKSLLLNLFLVMMVFSAAGVQSYGGVLTADPESPLFASVNSTYYYEAGLIYYNFNNFPASIVTLTAILLDSYLMVPLYQALSAVGRPASLIFFLVFWLIASLVVLNVVVAFILQAFMDEQKQKDDPDAGERGSDTRSSAGSAAEGGEGGVRLTQGGGSLQHRRSGASNSGSTSLSAPVGTRALPPPSSQEEFDV
jgi:two pore calcium channel protein, plant